MHDVPDLPDVADAPDVLSGHLWLQELVDGTPFRFQVQSAAPIRFGDDRRTFDADDAPRELRYAVHEIQRRLDRGALRRAVDDVESITFAGIAPHKQRVDYDWARLPGFLGMDVWDDDHNEFLPPDRAEQVFESLDLAPIHTLEKEKRAADFQPARYKFPDSAWRDGPVAGLILRNKTGGRAKLGNPSVVDSQPDSIRVDIDPAKGREELAQELADVLATDQRYRRIADAIDGDNRRSRDFDTFQTGVLDSIYREHSPTFEQLSVDDDAFRQVVAERTSEFIGSTSP